MTNTDREPAAILRVFLPSGAVREVALPSHPIQIGRRPDNFVAIPDPSVSRVHASIEPDGGGFWIRDLGSRNGVVLNGEKVRDRARFGPADRVAIGDVRLRLIAEWVDVDDRPAGAEKETTILTHDPLDVADLVVAPPFRGQTKSERSFAKADSILSFFHNVTDEIRDDRPFEEGLERIVDHLFPILPEAERACVLLADPVTSELRPGIARHKSGRPIRMRISRTIVRRAVDRLESVLVENPRADERFLDSESLRTSNATSLMCTPIVLGERAAGVLYAETSSSAERFGEEHLRLFRALGNIAAGHIERRRLLDGAARQRAYEMELEQAAAIQHRILHVRSLEGRGWSVRASSRPCHAVGGDYFDCIEAGDGSVVLAVGDVCGKGLGAALLMCIVHATVHAAVRAGANPLAICRDVDETLLESSAPDRFATLFVARFDPESGRLAYVNAGHDAPILLRAGAREPERLSATGLVAGAIAGAPLEEASTELAPGDLLFAYTDGIREAHSAKGEEFGEERILRVLLERQGDAPEEIVRAVQGEVVAFTKGAEAEDDQTQLVCRRLPR